MKDNENIRRSLFGYSVKDVCKYIAKLEEEFSTQIDRMNKSHTGTLEELNKKLEALEAECKQYREQREDIADTFIYVHDYADMRKKAVDEYLEKYRDEEIRKINDFKIEAGKLKAEMYDLFSRIDAEYDKLTEIPEIGEL